MTAQTYYVKDRLNNQYRLVIDRNDFGVFYDIFNPDGSLNRREFRYSEEQALSEATQLIQGWDENSELPF
jgi:hypothetical protein